MESIRVLTNTMKEEEYSSNGLEQHHIVKEKNHQHESPPVLLGRLKVGDDGPLVLATKLFHMEDDCSAF